MVRGADPTLCRPSCGGYDVAMPEYRRAYAPGGTFFFTAVTYKRRPLLCDPLARRLLRGIIRRTQQRWPFTIDAIVLLPDHLHTLWTLPEGDANFSTRWAYLKKEFTKAWLAGGGAEGSVSESRQQNRRRGGGLGERIPAAKSAAGRLAAAFLGAYHSRRPRL